MKTVTIPVTLNEYQLESICDCINERNEFERNSNAPLTPHELLTNPNLSNYIGAEIAMHLLDHWNDVALESVAEGILFEDIEDHR